MFNASFDTKCFSFSRKISLQLNFGSGHLVTASFFFVVKLNYFIVLEPHEGHFSGKLNFFVFLLLFSLSTYKTCGITSPAL